RGGKEEGVGLGFVGRGGTIEELATSTGLDREVVAATIARWNAQCDHGEDADFGRPPGTMVRLEPPFIFGQVWPAVSNTQGGPVHNSPQQIVDAGGNPIRRLYAAAELGSSFVHLYLSGVNIAECVVPGWVAGREAATIPAW